MHDNQGTVCRECAANMINKVIVDIDDYDYLMKCNEQRQTLLRLIKEVVSESKDAETIPIRDIRVIMYFNARGFLGGLNE